MATPDAVRMARRVLCATTAAALLATFVAASPLALAAQDRMAPMAPMAKKDSVGKRSQARQMHDLMGTPLPFGIMIGSAEQWMVGYQGMVGTLDGLLEGRERVTTANALTRFPAVPTKMTMQMHMGMLMYAPTARATAMVMLPYTAMSMSERHRDGTTSTEKTSGIGDVEVRGLYSLTPASAHAHRFLATFGVGIPTGSVNQHDPDGDRMEYPMQSGSGSYSLLPGLLYLGQVMPWSWGAQVNSTVRLGQNEHAYRLGDRVETRLWLARELTPLMSVSVAAGDESWGNIRGADVSLDPLDEPTKDPTRQGGTQLNTLIGVVIHPQHGVFKGQQLLIEADVPYRQSLNGPQLKRSNMLHAALQWAF